MPYLPHNFSIEDALASSQATYDLDFAEWGYRGGATPNDNLRFPPPGARGLPTTLAAISIGPKSTVDRCWVSWDRQKALVIPNDSNASDFTSDLRRLSIGTPLLYAQAAGAGTLLPSEDSTTVAMQRGLLYVFPFNAGSAGPHIGAFGGNTTVLPELYVDQWGVDRFMNASGGGSSFEAPYMHLVLGLRPVMFAPPTKRFPYMRTQNQGVLLEHAPRTCIAMVPIFGRKNVCVQLISRSTGLQPARTADFWVGLLRNINESGLVFPNSPSPVFEVNAGTALAVAPLTPVEFRLTNPCADYLAIYSTTTVGNNNVIVTIVAED